MKITALTPASIESHSRPGLLDSLAKRSLFRILRHLQGGQLTLTEGGVSHTFGDTNFSEEIICGETIRPIYAQVTVSNPAFFRMLMFHGSIGAGEAYMMNFWQTPDLVAVVRLLCRNMEQIEKMDGGLTSIALFSQKLKHWFSPNTISGSRKNIHAHYDLSNELFAQFLDKRMMYSAAMYQQADSDLESAAEFKLKCVGDKLELSADDHVVEIGSGWGGMAIFLAENYGCRVTTTTISDQQFNYAKQQVEKKNLGHLVTLLKQDYRLLEGKFDKLVSIEMIEAVGLKFLPTYFQKCDALLKKGGKMLIQAITVPEQRFDYARKNVDFIQRYIFPGGSLPSIEAMLASTGAHTRLQIDAVEDIGNDYARTLADWRRRFLQEPEAIKRLGFDEVFMRLWQFYLCYCEGGFTERAISTHQIVFRKI